ncbi:CPBP family intramembrane glutamic endopeptidase [Pleionea litopenaei]|uniref:Type II CAAX endopeptidase family protein n=1 Tax=Pleionea litopenaei TaxID=3070815 RepID=A0AA51X8T3_9GAMM|nr:type II CAAX endopeptidase family protein [Pleionea sp. HL-JVS1]WMS89274.1 type II CAAX endopeptidase family protein [Pleionea sp. HL-JVS1]
MIASLLLSHQLTLFFLEAGYLDFIFSNHYVRGLERQLVFLLSASVAIVVAFVGFDQPVQREKGAAKWAIHVLYVIITLLAAAVWALTVQLVIKSILEWSSEFPFNALPVNGFGDMCTTNRLALILVAVVFAPLIEEVLFRGVLLNKISKITSPLLAVTLTSVLFALLHGYSLNAVMAFTSSLLLGILYLKSQRLSLCIVAHATFNLTTTLVLC